MTRRTCCWRSTAPYPPLYTVGTAWKLRDTYLGAIRDPRGWFDFRGVYPKPVTVQ